MAKKDFFTACACVLFDRDPGLDPVAVALTAAGHEVALRLEAHEHWQFSGPSLFVAFRPEVFGYARIDLIDRPWPDDLCQNDPDSTASGWELIGAFGPAAFPGCLARAARQHWKWPESATIPARHQAFVRVRLSYMSGGDVKQRRIPADYDPIAELVFVARLTAAVAQAPGAIAYFNPNGEVLLPPDRLATSLALASKMDLPPVDLLAGVRFFDFRPDWVVMDIVGNSQFSHPENPRPMHDFEVCVPKLQLALQSTAALLVYSTTQLVRNGPIDSPSGQSGSAVVRRFGLVTPPRPTVRFFQGGGDPPPPEQLQADHDGPIFVA
jgi:hypothetical protein